MDFSNVRETFNKATDKIMKVSSEVVDTTKAGFAVTKTKNQMDAAYQSIGKLVFERYLDGDGVDDLQIKELCAELTELQKALLAQQELLRDLKNLKACPSCGKDVSKESKFCPFCGEAF